MIYSEHQKQRLIIYYHVSVVFEIVFNPVRHKIVSESTAVCRVRSVCRLPDYAVFHQIAVFGVHKSVVQMDRISCIFKRRIALIGVPAKCLEVYAVLGKKLDFPVSRFSASLVIISENRTELLIRRNA